MLDGAFTSPKIRVLAAMIEVPWPQAIGMCGLLWRFAAKHAPTGAVGKHSNQEISIFMEWTNDSDSLIDALVRCRLLDPVPPPERLLVHDWPEHAPRHVRASLQRQGLDFSTRYTQSHNDIELCHDDSTVVDTVVATVDTPVVTTAIGTTSTSTSSSTSSPTSTSIIRSVWGLTDYAEQIWDCYVPGRKQGKKPGVAAIEKSLKALRSEYPNLREAAEYIAVRTKRDRDRFVEEIRSGDNELKFVPQAVTYFKQERWNDDNEQINSSQIDNARITDEIARARGTSDLG